MVARRRPERDPLSELLAEKPESEYQAEIVKLARTLGYRCYHTFDSRKSEKGFLDLVLLKPPRLIIAEVKTEDGKLSKEQLEWYGALCLCPGVEVYVWRPRDWNEVIRILSGDGR